MASLTETVELSAIPSARTRASSSRRSLGLDGSSKKTIGQVELHRGRSLLQHQHASPADATTDDDAVPERVFEAAPAFTLSNHSRFAITMLIGLGNLMQFISNCLTLMGGLALSESLGRSGDAAGSNWMFASYSLTQGACVLVTGRLGAIYGHQRLSLIGMALFAIFSLANGFARDYNSFIAMRALTGMAAGVYMPNAVASITIMVPPGRSRNLILGFFAASPPIGGGIGGFLAGGFTGPGAVDWKWAFVIIASMSALIGFGLLYLFPKEQPVDRHGRFDYPGGILGLSSLLLFNVVWNQAPSVGWDRPYEIVLLIISVALFGLFLLWEGRYAKEPVMPLAVFKTPTFTALIFVVLLSYMAFGIGLWYSIVWQQTLRHESVMRVAVNFVPFVLGSAFAVGFAAWLIPRVAAQWILAIGVVVTLLANLILATMPVEQSYWAQMFPSTLLNGFCPDFVYVAAQIIASNSVSRQQQGVASSLIGTLNLYGISLGLGFAGTLESELVKGGADTVWSYRAALYFGAGLALIGLLLDFVYVRMPKDQREGWDEALESS